METLLGWIEMMKLECTDVPVVAAKATSAASLRYENPFDAPTPLGDLLRPAQTAPVAPIALVDEFHDTMTSTVSLDRRCAAGGSPPRAAVQGLEPVPP